MLFSSIPFLFFFLPVTLAVYYVVPRAGKNAVLLFFSLVFYAWGEPAFVLLMILSIVVNWWLGLRLEHARGTDHAKRARTWLVVAVIFNIGLLGFFKYADFIAGNIAALTGADISMPGLPLPIGISFYTFQILSYVIDLYWGRVWVQTNIIDLGTYVALFPQLIAGPIVRIRDVAVALRERQETFAMFAEGISRFVTGLAKKVLLANSIGAVWSDIQAMPLGSLPVLTAWTGILSFAFQIYFDFSAYSDMAIGLGLMFGFRFNENFDYPYTAVSITDFWRRWHISLSSWFREYVYIPLGGNRRGLPRQVMNLFIVWFLTGLWHGANWNFVLWGLYFAVLLFIEKAFLGKRLARLPKALNRLYTLFFVIISWVIFSFESVRDIGAYIGAMFGSAGIFADAGSGYHLLSNLVLFAVLIVASTPWPRLFFFRLRVRLDETGGRWLFVLRLAAGGVLLLLTTAHLVDAGFNPFLYFRF